jgi:hypothetical protein
MRRSVVVVVMLLLMLLGIASLGGCGDSQRADNPTTTAGVGSSSASAPSSGSSSSTSSSTSSTATSATATTIGSDDPLALRASGIGQLQFGSAADTVVAALVDQLGAPSDDRVETAFSSSYGVCPGEHVRVVEWAGFVTLFSDGETPFASGGSYTFFDWRLRDLGAATPPLQTPEGIDLGDTTAAVRAAFGGRAAVADDEIVGPSFRVGTYPDQLRGALTSVNDDGSVVALEAGSSCGE